MPKSSVEIAEQEPPVQEQHQGVSVSSDGAATKHTWRNVRLIIGREYKNRITQRSFVIVTIIILVLIVLAAFVPTVISVISARSKSQTSVGIIDNAGSVAGLDDTTLRSYINTALNGAASQQTGGTAAFAITMDPSTQLVNLQKQVQNGNLAVLLVLQRAADQSLHFTYYTNANATDDSNLTSMQTLAQQLSVLDTSHRLGLTQTQMNSLFAQPGFTVVSTQQNQDTRPESQIVAGYILAYAGNILIYMTVLLYGMSVAMGVAEEKGNRIMEILVNAATPFQLLVGKIVGIGAAGLTQMGCFVIVGIGALLIQNPLQAAILGPQGGGLHLDVTGASISLLLLLLLYFILGFLLYATLFAAMGALVKRQDEVQSAVQIPMMLLLAGYMMSYFGIFSPDATWIKIVSYVPFWSPTTMLARAGAGGVAWWEIVLTVGLMLVTIFACALLSARIYRMGILMYGQKPGLGQLAKLLRMK